MQQGRKICRENRTANRSTVIRQTNRLNCVSYTRDRDYFAARSSTCALCLQFLSYFPCVTRKITNGIGRRAPRRGLRCPSQSGPCRDVSRDRTSRSRPSHGRARFSIVLRPPLIYPDRELCIGSYRRGRRGGEWAVGWEQNDYEPRRKAAKNSKGATGHFSTRETADRGDGGQSERGSTRISRNRRRRRRRERLAVSRSSRNNSR